MHTTPAAQLRNPTRHPKLAHDLDVDGSGLVGEAGEPATRAARWRGGAVVRRVVYIHSFPTTSRTQEGALVRRRRGRWSEVVIKGGGQTAGPCAGPAQAHRSSRSRRDLGAISARSRRELSSPWRCVASASASAEAPALAPSPPRPSRPGQGWGRGRVGVGVRVGAGVWVRGRARGRVKALALALTPIPTATALTSARVSAAGGEAADGSDPAGAAAAGSAWRAVAAGLALGSVEETRRKRPGED